MKVYPKDHAGQRYLLIAIPMKPENYDQAVRLRNCMIGYGGFVNEVTEMDKIMTTWRKDGLSSVPGKQADNGDGERV